MGKALHEMTVSSSTYSIGLGLVEGDILQLWQGKDEAWHIRPGYLSPLLMECIKDLGGYDAALALLQEKKIAAGPEAAAEDRAAYAQAVSQARARVSHDLIEPHYIFGPEQNYALGSFQGIVPLVKDADGSWKPTAELTPRAHIEKVIELGGYAAALGVLEEAKAKVAKKHPALEEVSARDFEDKVLPANRLVLADLFNELCGPCKWLLPELEALQAEMGVSLKIVKIDTEKLPESGEDVISGILKSEGIRGVPTLMLFDEGKFKGYVQGAPRSKGQIRHWIESFKP